MSFENNLRKIEFQYEKAVKTLREEINRKEEQVRAVKNLFKSQELVTKIAAQVQSNAHRHIAKIVTRCLRAVFDRPYKFKILFERKRGQTEARLVFIRKGKTLDPVHECGGGPVDVAAFALRLACLLLQKPVKRRVLVLDEPFRFVSEKKEYRQKVADLLIALTNELDIQIIQVTHDPILAVGKVIEI
jgi:DNA repair exonuclease SbcCD ATPase subunit